MAVEGAGLVVPLDLKAGGPVALEGDVGPPAVDLAEAGCLRHTTDASEMSVSATIAASRKMRPTFPRPPCCQMCMNSGIVSKIAPVPDCWPC